MRLNFTKMHGQGNDFVMLNGITQSFELSAHQVRALANRHTGIGCDQVLVVEAATVSGADFRYRIYNADGGEVEHCGNGARCFVNFVRDEKLTDKHTVIAQTLSGNLSLHAHENGEVTVDMGAPRFVPSAIPFMVDGDVAQLDYSLNVQGMNLKIAALSMGNPHAVQRVSDVETAPVLLDGTLIENHERFPNRVNAGFMQIVSRDQIRLRVWERGAGETLACGTGACAAVVAGIRWGLLDKQVAVQMRGGVLRVAWQGGLQDSVQLSGPTQVVFRGQIEI
jgi:diaminopimelate epimerase